MAIEKYGAELLALLKREDVCLDRLLMLGRQNFFLYDREILRIEELTGFPVADLMTGDPDEIYAEPFLERLGVVQIDSMDFADYEGCSIVHDLNQPISKKLEGQYDVVYDGGTLEHIFNFPTAIKNCMKMVKEGGYFLSCTPSNGYNGHGFYQFSPELFCSLFGKHNGYELKLMAMVESVPGGNVYKVENPGEIAHRVGLNLDKPTLLVIAAKRLKADVRVLAKWPSQSDYALVWENGKKVDSPEGFQLGPLRRGVKALALNLFPKPLIDQIKYLMLKRRRKKLSLVGLLKVSFLQETNLSDF